MPGMPDSYDGANQPSDKAEILGMPSAKKHYHGPTGGVAAAVP